MHTPSLSGGGAPCRRCWRRPTQRDHRKRLRCGPVPPPQKVQLHFTCWSPPERTRGARGTGILPEKKASQAPNPSRTTTSASMLVLKGVSVLCTFPVFPLQKQLKGHKTFSTQHSACCLDLSTNPSRPGFRIFQKKRDSLPPSCHNPASPPLPRLFGGVLHDLNAGGSGTRDQRRQVR